MRRYLIFTALFGIVLFAADTTPPSISNVGVNPNPFSPNGDGKNDNTTISFTLSEPCDSVIITIPADAVSPFNLGSMAAGDNQWTYGDSLGDGTYYFKIDAWDTAGNKADSVDGTFTEDVSPPTIDSISAAPNPFSPNGDGIKDYLYIDWEISGTYPVGWDTLFNDTCLGYIVYDSTATPKLQYHPIHTFPPFNVYLYLRPADTYDHSITIKLSDFSNIVVSTDIPANESNPIGYRAGDLTNKFNGPWIAGEDGMKSGVDSVGVYAFTGNTSISIYTDGGDLVYPSDYWEIFRGDGGYRHIIGPDAGLSDGVYTYRIVAVDNADNTYEESHTFIVDNYPIKISSYGVSPDRISPQNQDFNYDKCTITYTITKPGNVNLKIYRSDTTLVRTLVNNVYQDSGSYAAVFDGKDSLGNFLAADTESTYTYVISVVDPLTSDANQVNGNIVVDNLAPVPPSLSQPATPTGNSTTDISGSAENSSTVKLYKNDVYVSSVTADASTGEFKFTGVQLSEGNNVFKASATDEVGNVSDFSSTVSVVYDSHPPYLVSVFPADNSYINQSPLDSVIVIVKDDASGVDTSSSHITVRKSGTTVSGTETHIAPDTLIYTFDTPLSNSGADDGVYSVEIVPVDSVGNVDTLYTTFTYDTQKPSISVSPPDSAILNSFASLTATITDSLSGVDFSNSDISITGPGGTVPGNLTNDGSTQMTFTPNPTLATNGGDDGRYNITTIGQDNAGNPDTLLSALLYDTRPPYVLETLPADSAYITAPIGKVWARVSDTIPGVEISGVKWTSSSVRLLRSDSTIVPGARVTSGDTIFWNLNDSLKTSGKYYILMHLEDNAGNTADIYTEFIYDDQSPVIVSLDPTENSARNDTIYNIMSEFSDGTYGSGINFDTSKTKIVLTDEGGNPVSGTINHSGDTLFYTLSSPIYPNGVGDGQYTVNVYGEDNAGNVLSPSNPYIYTFIYDSKDPYVLESYPPNDTQITTPISTVWARVSDTIPGITISDIDWSASYVRLLFSDSTIVTGTKAASGDTIFWDLSSPLSIADNYIMEIFVKDNAGNSYKTYTRFIFDQTPPVIVWTDPTSNDMRNDTIPEVRVILDDGTGSGINFDTTITYITLTDEGGNPVSGYTYYSGDTVIYHLNSSIVPHSGRDGQYTVNVFAQDNAGNVLSPSNPVSYTFLYDSDPAYVVETNPIDSAYVNTSLNRVWARVSDAVVGHSYAGVDFGASRIFLQNAIDTTKFIPGAYSYSGDTMFWSFGSLPDGFYIMNVNPKDSAGNESHYPYYFCYDLNPPSIDSILPLKQDTFANSVVDTLRFFVKDAGSGIDFSQSNVHIYNSVGSEVFGDMSHSGDTLILYGLHNSLTPGGSDDGEYSIITTLQDRAGNSRVDTTRFVYDSRTPCIANAIFYDGEIINYSIDSVWVALADTVTGISTSGVDPAGSKLDLYVYNNVDTSGITGSHYVVSDSIFIFKFSSLRDGRYFMRVIKADKAGNTDTSLIYFKIDMQNPYVKGYAPGGYTQGPIGSLWLGVNDPEPKSKSVLSASISLKKVSDNEYIPLDSAWLVDDTIVVDTLVVPLPDSGSSYDGYYEEYVSLYDNAGNTYYDSSLSFILDNTAPTITASIPDSGHQNWRFSDNKTGSDSLRTVQVDVSDLLGGVDSVSGINFAASTITLYKPDGNTAPGTKTYFDNGDKTGTIYWRLFDEDSLPAGEYRMVVHIEDNTGDPPFTHGNSIDKVITFNAVSTVPEVISWIPSAPYVNNVTRVGAVIKDNSGTGIDTAATIIKLEDPSTNLVSGTKVWSGDTIFWYVSSMGSDGSYKITVDAYSMDKSHNAPSNGFIYDTKAPSVRNWTPSDGQTVYTSPDTITITINDPNKSEITTVEDGRIARRRSVKGTKGTSPISYNNSSLLLYDIAGHLISGTKSYDTQKQAIYYDLDSTLVISGTYRMVAVVMDEAGNSTTDTANFQFVSSTNEPVILSVFPGNDTTVSTPLYSVYAEIQNYDTTKSYIEVQKRDGTSITGAKRFSGDTMFFDFGTDTFPIDGTENGIHHWYVHAILDTVEKIDSLTFNYNVDLVCMAPVIDSGIPSGDSTIAESLYIEGRSDSLAYDSLMVRNEDSSYTAGVRGSDSTGIFRFNLPLWYGNNNISLWSVDTYGNRSDTTKIVVKRIEPTEISVQLPNGLPFRAGNNNNIFRIISTGSGTAEITLYNLAGEFVWKDTKSLSRGPNPIEWNLTNESGSTVKNGIYIYIIHITLQDGTNQVIKKLVAVIK